MSVSPINKITDTNQTTVKHTYILSLESMTLVFIDCSLLSLVINHWQRVIKVPHDGRNVTFVWCVDDLFWMGGTSGGRGGFKWRQPAHHQLWTLQRQNFSICSNVKTNKKSTFLRRNALYWYKLCCDRFNMLGGYDVCQPYIESSTALSDNSSFFLN